MKFLAPVLVWLATAHGASAQSLTFASSTFVVGDADSGPCFVATADVNGDGKLDLISANYGFRWGLPGDPGGWGTNLVVLTNNGSGGFSFNAALTVGRGPLSVVATDVNGDGHPDLICANETDNNLTVLTNNGSGVFGSNATLVVGIRPHGVVAADVNGDGKPDLACVNAGTNTLTVLTNQGGGVFVFCATLPAGNEPLALAAADVNGDGKPDLTCANKNDDALTLLTNDGGGGFAFSATLPVGHFPDWVSAADVNGDGKPDLISVNWGAATMTVLTNGGNGGFGFSATPGVGNYPSSVAAADVNGDGRTDLICASTDANSLSVLTNNGSGAFGYNTTLATGRIPNVWSADLNGDGKPDLACPNFRDGTVTVLLNTTAFPQPWTTNNLPSGLIAWWQAEGNLLDSAGAHHGSGSASPTYAAGRFGQAFQFNGTDQSVSVPDVHADLDSWTQFTLEAWVNLDQTADFEVSAPGRMIFSKVGNAADETHFNQGYQFGPCYNATKIVLAFNTNGQAWPGFATIADLGAPLLTNTWYHLAGTYDHNAVKIYLNGVPLVTNVIGPMTLQNSGSSLRISKDDNLNCPFAGRIDDARIYNRALTEAEVAYVAQRLTLVNPGCTGTNFSFWFQTVSNFGYTVEYNNDLRTTNWLFHHTITGDGSVKQSLMPMTNAPQRFFRVRQP